MMQKDYALFRAKELTREALFLTGINECVPTFEQEVHMAKGNGRSVSHGLVHGGGGHNAYAAMDGEKRLNRCHRRFRNIAGGSTNPYPVYRGSLPRSSSIVRVSMYDGAVGLKGLLPFCTAQPIASTTATTGMAAMV